MYLRINATKGISDQAVIFYELKDGMSNKVYNQHIIAAEGVAALA